MWSWAVRCAEAGWFPDVLSECLRMTASCGQRTVTTNVPCPDGRQPRRGNLAGIRLMTLWGGAVGNDLLEADRVSGRLAQSDLAEVVVFLGGGQPGVRVGRSDHAEREGIRAK